MAMIMSSDGETTFMYRVGAIAVHDDRLLVEYNVRHGYCFVPGGRVEYGESAAEALARELREELGEEVEVGRLVLVTDNFFWEDNQPMQEVALYFLATFPPGSKTPERRGVFEGAEAGTHFQWIRLDEVEEAILFPPFLRERVRSLPQTPEYVVERQVPR